MRNDGIGGNADRLFLCLPLTSRTTHTLPTTPNATHHTPRIAPTGVFVPPGRKPQEGERKLYLFIEGKSEEQVSRFRKEVFRRLEEAALEAPAEKAAYSKY